MAKRYDPDAMRIGQNLAYLEIMDRAYEALGDLPPAYFEDVIEKFRLRALDFVESPDFKDFIDRHERVIK